jgi:hypothetical protein
VNNGQVTGYGVAYNPVQVEGFIEEVKDRIIASVKIIDDAEQDMKAKRRAYDHAFAHAMTSFPGPEYVRKASATLAAEEAKKDADNAEIAFHHAQREARSLEKELFAWQSILNSVRATYNATGGRG